MKARRGIVVGALALAGCTGHLPWARVPETTPGRVPVPVPASFSISEPLGAPPDGWWRSFGEPRLDALVERSFAGNLGLRQAWARLAQASAVFRRTGAGRWPEVTGQADVSRARSVFFAGEELGERQFTSEQLVGAFAASWELDVWRRVGSTVDAARLDREAARGDVGAAALSLAGEIADAWFALVTERAQLGLLGEQAEASRQVLELVELRFGQGLGAAPDVLQQRQQVASVVAQTPPVRAQIAALEHRLAVLSGSPPGVEAVATAEALPELPPVPPAGLPADLLRRRPDVRAAESRVAAADHRVAAAIADRFPAIRLTGRTGWQGFEASELPENWIWTIASNVVTPLFDAGRRRAEVDRTRAALEERLAAYGETVLRAFEEVENALVREAREREHVAELERQVDWAARTLKEIRWRYAYGLTEYLNVLTALQSLQQAERSLLAARGQQISLRIQLHRALGGSWTAELEPSLRLVKLDEP